MTDETQSTASRRYDRIMLVMDVLAQMDSPDPIAKAALDHDRNIAAKTILKMFCAKTDEGWLFWNGDDMRTTFRVLLAVQEILDPKLWSAKHIEAVTLMITCLNYAAVNSTCFSPPGTA
jgi:hypothetical protein